MVAEILLSDSRLRFSNNVSDAVEYLDEDELQTMTEQIAREMKD